MTNRMEVPEFGSQLERLNGFAKLLPVVSEAVMIPEFPVEKRWVRLERVAAWFHHALSEHWQPIGMRLQQGEDFEVYRWDLQRSIYHVRHIGSGVKVSGGSLPEAEQTLGKEVNRQTMDLRQEIKRDPLGILARVIHEVEQSLME